MYLITSYISSYSVDINANENSPPIKHLEQVYCGGDVD
jgi:hypothetical protein